MDVNVSERILEKVIEKGQEVSLKSVFSVYSYMSPPTLSIPDSKVKNLVTLMKEPMYL